MRLLNLLLAIMTIVLIALAVFSSQIFNDVIILIAISLLLLLMLKLMLDDAQFSTTKRLFVLISSILFTAIATLLLVLFPNFFSYNLLGTISVLADNPTFSLLVDWLTISAASLVFWAAIKLFWRALPWFVLICSSVIAGILAFPVSIILYLAIGSFIKLPKLI